MTSHELANELLRLPDLPAVNSDGSEFDGVEQDKDAGEIVLFSEDDDDEDENETTPTEDE